MRNQRRGRNNYGAANIRENISVIFIVHVLIPQGGDECIVASHRVGKHLYQHSGRGIVLARLLVKKPPRNELENSHR